MHISHKMAEILRIADDITVMRDGTWVATEPASSMTMDKIIRLMVGREPVSYTHLDVYKRQMKKS